MLRSLRRVTPISICQSTPRWASFGHAVFFQRSTNGFVANGFHDFQLGQFTRQQTQSPVALSGGSLKQRPRKVQQTPLEACGPDSKQYNPGYSTMPPNQEPLHETVASRPCSFHDAGIVGRSQRGGRVQPPPGYRQGARLHRHAFAGALHGGTSGRRRKTRHRRLAMGPPQPPPNQLRRGRWPHNLGPDPALQLLRRDELRHHLRAEHRLLAGIGLSRPLHPARRSYRQRGLLGRRQELAPLRFFDEHFLLQPRGRGGELR